MISDIIPGDGSESSEPAPVECPEGMKFAYEGPFVCSATCENTETGETKLVPLKEGTSCDIGMPGYSGKCVVSGGEGFCKIQDP